jgi:hypothetical protein
MITGHFIPIHNYITVLCNIYLTPNATTPNSFYYISNALLGDFLYYLLFNRLFDWRCVYLQVSMDSTNSVTPKELGSDFSAGTRAQVHLPADSPSATTAETFLTTFFFTGAAI